MKESYVCSESETVINRIISMLHSPENKGNRSAWQEFFLSDAFLDVFGEKDFLPRLVKKIAKREEEGFACNLDPVFLQELALVWQITADLALADQWGQEQEQERQALLKLLFRQLNPECLIWDEDVKIPDRSDSFHDLGRLLELAKQGKLDSYGREEWGNLAYRAEELYAADPLAGEEYLPTDFSVHREEKLTRNEIMEPDSRTCVRMQAYLVRRYGLTEKICLSMWENFEVEGRMGGYPLCSYEPVLSEMEKKYPNLTRTPEGELILWKKALLQYGERMPLDVKSLFEHPVFLAHREELSFIRWLGRCLRCRQFPREILETLYAYYREEESRNLDREELVELLLGWLSRYDRQNEERQKIFPEPEDLKITLHNLHFWTYFLCAAYPYSSDKRAWPKGDIHRLLHCYMDQIYRPSVVWRTAFAGYDQEKEQVLCPHRFRLSLNKSVGQVDILFGLHHVEYKINEEPVYEQRLPFSMLAELDDSEEGILHFFLLLPLAVLREEDPERMRREIFRRLTFLPLQKVSLAYLTDCLLDNQEWKMPEEDRRKQVRCRCFSEDDNYCFRSTLYLGKFIVEVRAPGGWKTMELGPCDIPEVLKKEPYCRIPGWDGILKSGSVERLYMVPKKQARREILQKITDAFLPPHAVRVKTFPAEGGRGQKAAIIRRALAESLRRSHSGYQDSCLIKNRGLEDFLKEDLQGQWVHTKGNVMLHFATEQNRRQPKILYFMATSSWKPEFTVLSITGQCKKDVIRQEKRLRRRICQGHPLTSWGKEELYPVSLFTVCGYLMVEGQRPFPVGIGDDGTFYTFRDHRLTAADDFQRFLQACLEPDGLIAVSCCQGNRTTCRLNGKPGLWYEYERDYESGNYPAGKFRQLMKEG